MMHLGYGQFIAVVWFFVLMIAEIIVLVILYVQGVGVG
jgi:hypothetical protein